MSVPLLIVELLPGETATAEEFLSHLEGRIARWWMPDEVRFVVCDPHDMRARYFPLEREILDYLVNGNELVGGNGETAEAAPT